MQALTATDVFVIILSAAAFIVIWLRKSATLSKSLPPGPKGYPVIGSLFDMPTTQEWLTFARWGKIYGGLCSINIAGTTIVIINSYQAAIDMLDKKGAIYADRPYMAMVGDLMDWEKAPTVANGPVWKASRALLQQEIGTHERLNKYQVMQQEHVHAFLRRLVGSPSRFREYILQYASAVVLGAAYAYKIEQEHDPLVILVNEVMATVSAGAAPGTFWVNYLPILRYVPSWFPGAGFQRFAAYGRELAHRLVNEPLDFVKRQMAQGNAQESFTLNQISAGTPEELIKWTAATFCAAGQETTTATIYSFFHAMVLNPGIQKEVQREMIDILGPCTLPTFSDRDNLLYLNSVLKEVLRFHPVAPTGVPRYTSDSDIQNGYFIPKNSLVFANAWNMCHDPETYKDPMTFNPLRFMGENPELDPREIVFGFGRRICPGQLLADASIYIVCASTLALFDITPAVDDAGKPVLPAYEYTSGITSEPIPFQCTIRPHSSEHLALIMD